MGKIRAKALIREDAMADFAAASILNMREVRVHNNPALPAHPLLHSVQHPGEIGRAAQRAAACRVQVGEVNARQKAVVQPYKSDNLFQCAQHAGLAHGLQAQADCLQAFLHQQSARLQQPLGGIRYRVLARPLLRRAHMHHQPLATHEVQLVRRLEDIAKAFVNGIRPVAAQVNVIGRVRADGYTRLLRRLANINRCVIRQRDAAAKGVLKRRQPHRPLPGKGLHRALIPFLVKALGIAGRAKARCWCMLAHCAPVFWSYASQKGW